MPSRPRNVWFYDGSTGELLGGVQQNGSITNENFFEMLTGVLLVNTPITIHSRDTGQQILQNHEPLEKGHYDIFCAEGAIRLTDEVSVLRLPSHSQSGREDSFRDGVRARDRKCVLTGVICRGASEGRWGFFQAAHIIPLKEEALFNREYSRFITNNTTGNHTAAINSVQNGMLLCANMHIDFDSFQVSVNPNDGYKITHFGDDNYGVDGNVLEEVCRRENDPNRVADQFLRWHFRQSVLANMKKAGEPIWEHDFPPGTDMVKEIVEGPKAAQRMELELYSRLQGFEQDDSKSVH